MKPEPGEIEEARRFPNGWVYRIAGDFGPDDRIPPEAIVGAWKVDERGVIVGDFIKNERYDPVKWPGRLGYWRGERSACRRLADLDGCATWREHSSRLCRDRSEFQLAPPLLRELWGGCGYGGT